MRKSVPVLMAAVTAGLLLAGNASAAINLVTNGDFSTNGGNGQLGYNTTAAGWSVPNPGSPTYGSYTFVYNAGPGVSGTTADTSGANGQYGNVALWGPGDGGGLNGLTLSPDGGAFLASDPVYQSGAITQTIAGGLSTGAWYHLTFYFAGAQQTGFSGATFDGWNVTLGGAAVQSTATLNVTNHGFTGWQMADMYFMATGANSTLSFLATGGPAATLPPFALLDGVTLVAVPEPTTWALMIMGFGGIGAMVRTRRRQAALAA